MSSSTSAILYAATVATPSASSARPDDSLTKEKAHHRGQDGRFTNPWDSWTDPKPLEILPGMIKRRILGHANIPNTKPPTVPVHKPTFLPSRETNKLRATWLGHACYYVEYPSGLRVLFDPVFTDRCSPFSWLGPKRYTEMPCKIADIPIIDAVVISHSHYDHLSLPTVTEISRLHPNCQFFAPLGNKKWFLESNIKNITELDWWDEVDLTLNPTSPSATTTKDPNASKTSVTATTEKPASSSSSIAARISCLPCQHMSGRTPFDRCCTLWSSWSVVSTPSNLDPNPTNSSSVYFGGDTGYRAVPALPHLREEDYDDDPAHLKSLATCPAFSQIGKHRGPFDLGLIPIGAYMPRWIMSPMHANPKDAVNIFLDTKCKRAMGIHWGTWVLTEEDVLEPPRRLKEALKWKGVPETGVFDVCDIGDSKEFDKETS
ncbi:MAG: hypothetical protein Q9160_005496 [Pyrenula sp. 1 TL-2023]